MDKLLHWSVTQTHGDEEGKQKAGAPNPELLAQLFGAGGPDEPTLMKQNLSCMVNEEATLENREVACDNFEMLIENLDNANNIENMKMWPEIIKLLSHKDPVLRLWACSIIGSAVQNNPNAQEAFFKQPGAVEKLITCSVEENQDVSLKAIYALSSVVRNFKPACTVLCENDQGLLIVPRVLNSSQVTSPKVYLRALSLLSAILSNGVDAKMKELISQHNVVEPIVSLLDPDHPHSNLTCVDKILNLISHLAQAKYPFSKEDISAISAKFEKLESVKESLNGDDLATVRQVVNGC